MEERRGGKWKIETGERVENVEERRGGKWKTEKKGERKFVKGIREQR